MSYQRKIARQFEILNHDWMNNRDAPQAGGFDLLVGQNVPDDGGGLYAPKSASDPPGRPGSTFACRANRCVFAQVRMSCRHSQSVSSIADFTEMRGERCSHTCRAVTAKRMSSNRAGGFMPWAFQQGRACFKMVELDHLAAATRADHRHRPQIVAFTGEIDLGLIELLREFFYADAVKELWFAPRPKRDELPRDVGDDRPKPEQEASDRVHAASSGSLNRASTAAARHRLCRYERYPECPILDMLEADTPASGR
jgi:hypothetical protein